MVNKDISGVCLINKSKGISSFKALGPLKKKWKTRKVGFAGTLDPDASGLLVVAVGQGTKLLQFAEELPKTYRFEVIPGCSSDSYDITGNVIQCAGAELPGQDELERELKNRQGPQEQLPPRYSAIKIEGKRACDRVRAGEKVKLSSRSIHIYELRLMNYAPEKWTLEMCCSKGTYVRSLAYDLGVHFGCGGLAQNIIRTKIGRFELPEEGEPQLMPISEMVSHLLKVKLLPDFASMFVMGREVKDSGFEIPQTESKTSISENDFCQVWDPQGEFLGLGRIKKSGVLAPQRMCVVPEVYLKAVRV